MGSRLLKRGMDRETLANDRAQSEILQTIKETNAAVSNLSTIVTANTNAIRIVTVVGEPAAPPIDTQVSGSIAVSGQYPPPFTSYSYDGTTLTVVGLPDAVTAKFLVY